MLYECLNENDYVIIMLSLCVHMFIACRSETCVEMERHLQRLESCRSIAPEEIRRRESCTHDKNRFFFHVVVAVVAVL